MRFKHQIEPVLLYGVLTFCCAWLVYVMLANELPLDVGDGVMHFFISQASWKDPSLFLNHWGKPLFILFSSPFAQFGFNGMVIFNIVIYASSILIGYAILRKFDVSVWIRILFPLIIIIPVDSAGTILGALTEPLFNLSLLLAVYLLLERKWLLFALLVSFMPFLRSEGQLAIMLGGLILVANKSIRNIPFLATGFIMYATAGLFVFHDFWWYFTQNPYDLANKIYGQGTWDHYLISYRNYLGNPGIYVLILAVPSLIYLLIKKRWNDSQMAWSFFSGGMFFGVVFVHSYMWSTGQSSLGLTRLATQGMPAFVLLNLYFISRINVSNHIISKVLFGIFAAIMIGSLFNSTSYPKKAAPLDRQVMETAKYLKSLDLKGKKVHFYFPLLSFAYGENSFSPNNKKLHSFASADLGRELNSIIKPGDLLVRDSHFGPMEMGITMDELNSHPELVKIKEFISAEQLDDPYGETEGVFVYQYIPLKNQKMILSDKTLLTLENEFIIVPEQEFTDIQSLLPKLVKDTKVTFSISATVKGFNLTYDYNNLMDYSNLELEEQKEIRITYLFREKGKTKLYIWNPKKISGKVHIKNIELENAAYHPFEAN